jgi:hypothetical protein
MIHFNNHSWHYRLVLYVFGKNFFIEKDGLDFAAMEKAFDPKLPIEDRRIIYKTKPKVVNFCPYCRGVLWSALSLPIVYVWRTLFPHDPTKEMTHAQTMRRMKIRGILIRSIAGSVQFPFALMNYLGGNFEIAIVQVFIGFAIIGTFVIFPGNKRISKFFNSPINKQIRKILGTPFKYLWILIKPLINHIVKYFEEKDKNKPMKAKNPNIVVTYLQSKHHALCPPVCFIDKRDQENLK